MSDRIIKRKIISIVVCGMIFLAVWLFFFIRINSRYGQIKDEVYKKGETFNLNGVDYTYKGTQYCKGADVENMVDMAKMGMRSDDIIVITELEATNSSDESKMVLFDDKSLEKDRCIAASVDMQIYYAMNEVGIEYNIDAGETVNVKIPYRFTTDDFTDNEKNSIENVPFKLVTSLYPVKKSIDITRVAGE